MAGNDVNTTLSAAQPGGSGNISEELVVERVSSLRFDKVIQQAKPGESAVRKQETAKSGRFQIHVNGQNPVPSRSKVRSQNTKGCEAANTPFQARKNETGGPRN